MLTLQNIVVPTHNFIQTVTSYRDVLDLPVLQESDTYCFVKAGAVNLAIHPVHMMELIPTGHGFYLDLVADDLPALKAKLQQAKVVIQKEWTDNEINFLLVADPNGNLLEIYDR